jgi:hypothetical protein
MAILEASSRYADRNEGSIRGQGIEVDVEVYWNLD